jgi:predicted DNA-binding transcriptional regulator YafY
MDPTIRVLQLMTLLQQRPDWSSAELTERLGVTSRTLRRDVTRLRELGYAVDATPGRLGGYRLRAGSVLPPLVLTDDEAVVLAVGLRAAALSGLSGSGDTAVSALSKLEELLPNRLRARITALGSDVVSLAGPGRLAADPTILAVLALACRRSEQVALAYTDSRGQTTHRDIAAYRVVHAAPRWYLVAYDLRRKAWRTFRIDRVIDAQPLGGRATFDAAPDAAALVAEAITTAVYRWATTIRLELAYDRARQVVGVTVGQLSEETSATTLLRIGTDDLDWLARYLVGLTCDLEVIDPPELVTAIETLGRELKATGSRITRPRSDS